MRFTSHPLSLSIALVAVVGLAACGSEADSATTEPAAAPPDTAESSAVEEDAESEEAVDEDHGDEDHADDGDDHSDGEDHGDEGEDHSDEDHDDEDHDDDDHDDEDHDDKDEHGDEDHDEHGDEEHGDDDHDHDGDSGELGAHEHGTAELSVAWIGDEVTVDLISPNFNVFGFEYEPTSEEDLAIEADRTEALTADGVVVVNDAAGCTLADPAATEVERDGSHSEITVSWRFVCDTPDEVSELDFAGLFSEFPGFEDVDAQWISDSEQSAAELSPTSTTLSLRG